MLRKRELLEEALETTQISDEIRKQAEKHHSLKDDHEYVPKLLGANNATWISVKSLNEGSKLISLILFD